MKMERNLVKIESNSQRLKIQIEKDFTWKLLHQVLVGFLIIVHVSLVLFIFSLILRDGAFGMKVFFILFTLFLLWTNNNQLREFLIFFRGKETIRIDDAYFQYYGEYEMFKKALSMKLGKIHRLELKPLGRDRVSQSSNIFCEVI